MNLNKCKIKKSFESKDKESPDPASIDDVLKEINLGLVKCPPLRKSVKNMLKDGVPYWGVAFGEYGLINLSYNELKNEDIRGQNKKKWWTIF